MTRDVERIGGAAAAKNVYVQCITGVEQVLELVGTDGLPFAVKKRGLSTLDARHLVDSPHEP